MKRFHVHLFALLCVTSTLHCQDFLEAEHGSQPNHLVPVSPDYSDYRKRVADHLLVTPAEHGLMIGWTSFSGEFAIAVYERDFKLVLEKHGELFVLVPVSGKSFFITYTQAKESLWYSMPENNDQKKEKKVEVERRDLEISPRLAVAIQRAWGRTLIRTRYPEKAYRGLDGITYEFGVFVRFLGFLRGEIWTPDRGLPAKMAELGGRLRDFARSAKPITPEQEEKLIEDLSALEKLATKP